MRICMYISGFDKDVSYLPIKLQMLISETLGDEVLWKEQFQADGCTQSDFFSSNAKTRYIQIHSLDNEDSIVCSDSSSIDYKKLNLEVLSESEGCEDSQKKLNNIPNSQTLSSVLKETTV